MKNSNITPITYAPGTGANFLSYFITSANDPNPPKMILSDDGHAHFAAALYPHYMGGLYRGFKEQTINHINHFLSIDTSHYPIKKFYPVAHMKDFALLTEYFEKLIVILYDNDDIETVGKIYLGKWARHVEPYEDIKVLYQNILRSLKFYKDLYFKYNPKLEPATCFVHWKEIYVYDTSILISKLSKFTSTPEQNFNVENLNTWRESTRECEAQVTQLLNTV